MKRRTCALLVDYFGGDYQSGLIGGAEEAAIHLDTHLVIAVGRWLSSPDPLDAVQNDVFKRIGAPGTDAVVVASGCLSHYVGEKELTQFCSSFAPLPVASISVQVPGTASLVIDNQQGQREVLEHLIEHHRCRRIAYLRGPETSIEADQRLLAYCNTLEAHGIAYDPRLVLTGNFWVDSGRSCAEQLLSSGTSFDAIAGANDYMALGAMDVLKERGIRVPGDVRVVGFDDVPLARMASPSLTTVRQPLQRMGAQAVQLLWERLAGHTASSVHTFDVELVRRQSCGCGFTVRDSVSKNILVHPQRLSADRFEAVRRELAGSVLDAVCIHSEIWPDVIERLLGAITMELQGRANRFLQQLSELLDQHKMRLDLLDQFYIIVEAIRSSLIERSFEICDIEEALHAAVLVVGEWINRSQMRTLFDIERSDVNLRASVERISTALTHPALSEALQTVIPTTHIPSACFGLYESDNRDRLRAFSVSGVANPGAVLDHTYEPTSFAPIDFFPTDRRASYVLMPLTHGETVYGQALFETGDQRGVYAMLREQVGATLKAADMHHAVVEETARRERAERERLERDTEIAQQIQTAILPKSFAVHGLDVAAVMQPATSVGGDYYDVIPTEDGAYIGIGDVTGHGLFAGLIMLMVQSMVNATVHANPGLPPSALIPPINKALHDNVRYRLGGTDYVTLTLIKYHQDGALLLAGAHEEPLVWRIRTGQCERIASSGFWSGAIADVTDLTTDVRVQLEPGDLLVLYTDGITEAMNERREQFGLARLSRLVERTATEMPNQICEAVLAAVAGWSGTQVDDVSLLIARYVPNPT